VIPGVAGSLRRASYNRAHRGRARARAGRDDHRAVRSGRAPL